MFEDNQRCNFTDSVTSIEYINPYLMEAIGTRNSQYLSINRLDSFIKILVLHIVQTGQESRSNQRVTVFDATSAIASRRIVFATESPIVETRATRNRNIAEDFEKIARTP